MVPVLPDSGPLDCQASGALDHLVYLVPDMSHLRPAMAFRLVPCPGAVVRYLVLAYLLVCLVSAAIRIDHCPS